MSLQAKFLEVMHQELHLPLGTSLQQPCSKVDSFWGLRLKWELLFPTVHYGVYIYIYIRGLQVLTPVMQELGVRLDHGLLGCVLTCSKTRPADRLGIFAQTCRF